MSGPKVFQNPSLGGIIIGAVDFQKTSRNNSKDL